MTKQDWIRKLTSRKFWVMIVSFITALLIFLKKDPTDVEQIGSLIMMAVAPIAYILGEAWTDAASAGTFVYADAEVIPEQEKPPENE